ncbi:MAG: hypothetical protein JXR96_24650 [Deltaproteobacteria bacterium]|nr:hypothetical protein [Deltaproteobacteria bacterium]
MSSRSSPLLFMAICAIGCQSYEVSQEEICCWVRTTAESVSGLQRCVFNAHCTFDGQAYVCPCGEGCSCAAEPPADGSFDIFGCHWQEDYCYRGPEMSPGQEVGTCSCVVGFPCWAHCLGHEDRQGGFECEIDGEVQACVAQPDLDSQGEAHFCDGGANPWAYEDALEYYRCE